MPLTLSPGQTLLLTWTRTLTLKLTTTSHWQTHTFLATSKLSLLTFSPFPTNKTSHRQRTWIPLLQNILFLNSNQSAPRAFFSNLKLTSLLQQSAPRAFFNNQPQGLSFQNLKLTCWTSTKSSPTGFSPTSKFTCWTSIKLSHTGFSFNLEVHLLNFFSFNFNLFSPKGSLTVCK